MSEQDKVSIEVVEAFKFAHRGCDVVEYPVGVMDVEPEVAELAIREKWAKKASKPKKD